LALDEPCQGFGYATSDAIHPNRRKIVTADKHPVIYTTHHSDEVPKGINRLLRLKGGRIVQSGALRAAGKLEKT